MYRRQQIYYFNDWGTAISNRDGESALSVNAISPTTVMSSSALAIVVQICVV